MIDETTHIVKRSHAHSEPFDERKLYASMYAVCLSVRAVAADAEVIAGKVCEDIKPWLAGKSEVTSLDIRHHAAEALKRYNPDAAYLYRHHRSLG